MAGGRDYNRETKKTVRCDCFSLMVERFERKLNFKQYHCYIQKN